MTNGRACCRPPPWPVPTASGTARWTGPRPSTSCCATAPMPPRSCRPSAAARQNARMVRTALTREVWEAVNDTYMILKEELARPVRTRDLPEKLAMVRQQSALVRGALHGTMLRNDIFDFCRLGTFLERADNTARILRREILRAPALDQPDRIEPRQRAMGDDPALGRGPARLSLAQQGREQSHGHRRFPDLRRAHAAIAAVCLHEDRHQPGLSGKSLRHASSLP